MRTLEVDPAAGPVDSVALRAAMLSVYDNSLGRQFQIRGAPSVLLPPEIRPVPLDAALDTLRACPMMLREAIWLIVRATPIRGLEDPLAAYPHELDPYVSQEELRGLVDLLKKYHRGANVFAAALVACREGDEHQFEALRKLLEEAAPEGSETFSAVIDRFRQLSAAEFLDFLTSDESETPGKSQTPGKSKTPTLSKFERTQSQVKKLEGEVGLSIYEFIDELASAFAFDAYAEDLSSITSRDQAAPMGRRSEDPDALTIYPVSTVIRQDSRTLVTTATVTTLANGTFEALRAAIEPQSWAESSEVIERSCYVTDEFDLKESRPRNLFDTDPSGPPLLLDEIAHVYWGPSSLQQASFHNVLSLTGRLGSKDDPSLPLIDIDYWLRRSIDSRVLWDGRAGGLRENRGYFKVRSLGGDSWRVTVRKVIRFSDRTPYSGGRGWLDFGEMLNYLAPAALAWWVEKETYSLGDKRYPDPQSASNSSRSSRDGYHE